MWSWMRDLPELRRSSQRGRSSRTPERAHRPSALQVHILRRHLPTVLQHGAASVLRHAYGSNGDTALWIKSSDGTCQSKVSRRTRLRIKSTVTATTCTSAPRAVTSCATAAWSSNPVPSSCGTRRRTPTSREPASTASLTRHVRRSHNEKEPALQVSERERQMQSILDQQKHIADTSLSLEQQRIEAEQDWEKVHQQQEIEPQDKVHSMYKLREQEICVTERSSRVDGQCNGPTAKDSEEIPTKKRRGRQPKAKTDPLKQLTEKSKPKATKEKKANISTSEKSKPDPLVEAKPALKCVTCGKLFRRRANLNLHQKMHLGIKQFKCEICPKAFITRQKLKEHQNVHTGQAPYQCTSCDANFKRFSNMVQHRHRHHSKEKNAAEVPRPICKEDDAGDSYMVSPTDSPGGATGMNRSHSA